jgi:BirA family biotin operon repressor/biotin-[acetyl-CoA-carboxylase] ligase
MPLPMVPQRPARSGAGDPARGYAGRVRLALPPFFQPLEVAAALPSTMTRAAELAAAGAPEGATVVADVQSAGRGRLERAWTAPPGSSLLLSVVLRPRLAPADAWLTAAAAGVALADAVRELLDAGPAVGLKWPNDLLVGGRKAAGLLAEARAAGDRLEWVLLGVGVNVGQGADGFPAELAGRATSVALAAGAPVDRVRLLAAWARAFLAGYRALAAGHTGAVLAGYRERLDTLGRPVRAELLGSGPVTGVAVGLGPTGGLVIHTPAGRRVEVAAGDVEHLRPAGQRQSASGRGGQPPTLTGTSTE